MENNIYTMGVDVGGSYIKLVLMDYSENPKVLDKKSEKIRKRQPSKVAKEMIAEMIEKNGLEAQQISYLASTGEGEMVESKTGHFYGMTTHAKGAQFIYGKAKTVVDMGALYVRAIKVNEQARVINYKMTGQCASGSGQFVENISRYLGLSIEEVGTISLQADKPETPSGICAVLAETDVINMVSRGISTPNIVKGIHMSIANRVLRLITSLKAESPIVLTGGMAQDSGMVEALKEVIKASDKLADDIEVNASPDGIYAGALGAALWGGYRHLRLAKEAVMAG